MHAGDCPCLVLEPVHCGVKPGLGRIKGLVDLVGVHALEQLWNVDEHLGPRAKALNNNGEGERCRVGATEPDRQSGALEPDGCTNLHESGRQAVAAVVGELIPRCSGSLEGGIQHGSEFDNVG